MSHQSSLANLMYVDPSDFEFVGEDPFSSFGEHARPQDSLDIPDFEMSFEGTDYLSALDEM